MNVLEFDPINSMHIHANFFHYFPTGTSLEPAEYTDTIMQCQGQRGILELRFPYAGQYMFHAHQSEFAQLGWMGLFEVAADGGRGARRGRAAAARAAAGVGPGPVPLALIAPRWRPSRCSMARDSATAKGPPVEELAVERTVLHPGRIELTVRNDGPGRRDDRAGDRERRLRGLRGETTPSSDASTPQDQISYPWIEGEAYDVQLLTSTGATITHEIPVGGRDAGHRPRLLRPDGPARALRGHRARHARHAVAAVRATHRRSAGCGC